MRPAHRRRLQAELRDIETQAPRDQYGYLEEAAEDRAREIGELLDESDQADTSVGVAGRDAA